MLHVVVEKVERIKGNHLVPNWQTPMLTQIPKLVPMLTLFCALSVR